MGNGVVLINLIIEIEMKCTEERFLNDVKDHKIEVINNNGVFRHLRFSKGSFDQQFDIVTWPWRLCFTGDMGTYVFSRVDDMFNFFRRKPETSNGLYINLGYWAEKVLAVDKHGGVKEYSTERLIEVVWSDVDNYVEYHELDPSEEAQLRESVEDEIIQCLESDETLDRITVSDYKWGARDIFFLTFGKTIFKSTRFIIFGVVMQSCGRFNSLIN